MLRLLLALVVSYAPLAAQDPAPRPLADVIQFAVVSPSGDTVLERGKPVTVEATVEYDLVSKDTAFIRVLALDSSGKPFAGFEPAKVGKGRSMYKCAGTIKVPKMGEVLLLVARLYDLVPWTQPDNPSSDRAYGFRYWRPLGNLYTVFQEAGYFTNPRVQRLRRGRASHHSRGRRR